MTNIEELKSDFINKNLFDLALTHRSWVNEHKGVRESNERLEFLGDAILEFVVSRKIYNQFKDKEEGFLTALRANLVNTKALCDVAKNLNIGDSLYLSKGEIDTGGRTNGSLLADTVEAIIGAIFIDRGIDSAEQFINDFVMSDLEKKASMPLKDAKSTLQEYVQSQGFTAPNYRVISQDGPDHSKSFTIQVEVNSKVWGTGTGKSKAEAEQASALHAIKENVKYP